VSSYAEDAFDKNLSDRKQPLPAAVHLKQLVGGEGDDGA
jgi:hypothetical protein